MVKGSADSIPLARTCAVWVVALLAVLPPQEVQQEVHVVGAVRPPHAVAHVAAGPDHAVRHGGALAAVRHAAHLAGEDSEKAVCSEFTAAAVHEGRSYVVPHASGHRKLPTTLTVHSPLAQSKYREPPVEDDLSITGTRGGLPAPPHPTHMRRGSARPAGRHDLHKRHRRQRHPLQRRPARTDRSSPHRPLRRLRFRCVRRPLPRVRRPVRHAQSRPSSAPTTTTTGSTTAAAEARPRRWLCLRMCWLARHARSSGSGSGCRCGSKPQRSRLLSGQ